MATTSTRLRDQARTIWDAGLAAVRPEPLLHRAVESFPADWVTAFQSAPRILVVGCGKAGAAMAVGLESALTPLTTRLVGLVNIPEGSSRSPCHIRLNAARPAGSNHPTSAGVLGADEMLRLLASAGPDDVAVALISGGGSALLPAPVAGITLEDKQAVTKRLHGCGATIDEMNAVRKHLSRVKGGQLAAAFRGRLLVSLIISDVVGDPLDVIASGPTAADPTTFADAIEVLTRYSLWDQIPASVRQSLESGVRGERPETLKVLPSHIQNRVLGSNAVALDAAESCARQLGFTVLNLGPFVEGETREVAKVMMGIVRSIQERGRPVQPPACLLSGGETTVRLSGSPGLGGRNQAFVLAALLERAMPGVCVLSAGTDGEDGPTDAAGAVGDAATIQDGLGRGLQPRDHLDRDDSYRFFDAVGGLIRTGLTETNVTDVRVILVE